MTTTSNYPSGEAGPDSESGTVDASAVDGADDTSETGSADLESDGSLGPGSTATGGSTEEATSDAVGPGGVHAEQVDHDPESLVERGRVATAEDME